MSWHIISPLQRMFIFWTVLWDKTKVSTIRPVEYGFHVYPNIGVCILIDAQSATRMLAEYVDDTSLRQLGQLTYYLASHQMEAS
jgi:hypothetical protein